MSRLVLASASPRRLELLKQIHITPDLVLPADINEDELKGELPKKYVERITRGKIEATLKKPEAKDSYVISADTTVACGRLILPKSEDPETARMCLEKMSGRRHIILGGIAVADPSGQINYRCVETTVKFKRLTAPEIQTYIDSREWDGKAGGYGIQGMAAQFITFLSGSYSNVVGLSLYDIAQMLKGSGYATD